MRTEKVRIGLGDSGNRSARLHTLQRARKRAEFKETNERKPGSAESETMQLTGDQGGCSFGSDGLMTTGVSEKERRPNLSQGGRKRYRA